MIVNDGAAALAKYRNGELEEAAVQPAQAASVNGDSTLNRQLIKTPNLTVFWIVFRVNSPPLNNVRVRQALSQAIDRGAFASQVFQGEATPAQTFIPQGMHGYSPGLTGQKFDVAQARASLAASGLSANVCAARISWAAVTRPVGNCAHRLSIAASASPAGSDGPSSINAFQSAVFNAVLDGRVAEGSLATLREGDLAFKHDNHAVFAVSQPGEPAG